MERDHRNRADKVEARIVDTEAAAERGTVTSENTLSIPRSDARNLLRSILDERAEVFWKLAR